MIRTKWICRNCGPLPVTDFYAHNRHWCKKCLKERLKKWKQVYQERFGRKYR
jgi:hypothetical protein